MSKHGISLLTLKAKKMGTFFDKISAWRESVSFDDKKSMYHCLLVFAAEQIPLVHQDEVIQKAQDMFYENKQQGR